MTATVFMDRFSHAGKGKERIPMALFNEVGREIAYMRCGIVNVIAIGNRSRWILVDAGVRGYGRAIHGAAEARFGPGSAPAAIVLTHGHFDHVGALDHLLGAWDVPVYAHPLEMPYLTGRSQYPPPDPLVGGGGMALLSRAYPRGPIDLGDRARELPGDGTVPDVGGWRWVHTPGHTPGHVSLFRDVDRTLVSGDALITTKQESMTAVLTQRREMHGPPAYFTPDWDRSRESVHALAGLAPDLLVPGHGQAWRGEEMRDALYVLAEHFDVAERPRFGRYAMQPAIADATGVVMLPRDPLPAVLAGLGAIAATAGLAWAATSARKRIVARHM
jgi:glyoxylase-like metal-dependent hydrolase (beta-lactamase superfamily II)